MFTGVIQRHNRAGEHTCDEIPDAVTVIMKSPGVVALADNLVRRIGGSGQGVRQPGRTHVILYSGHRLTGDRDLQHRKDPESQSSGTVVPGINALEDLRGACSLGV